jgi:hypothetical protein
MICQSRVVGAFCAPEAGVPSQNDIDHSREAAPLEPGGCVASVGADRLPPGGER